MTAVELDIRGTPTEQIRIYLRALGGTEQPDGAWLGPGWRATARESEYPAMGAVLPRVILELTGEQAIVARIAEGLRIRVWRVGG